jgi:hypothetical protein
MLSQVVSQQLPRHIVFATKPTSLAIRLIFRRDVTFASLLPSSVIGCGLLVGWLGPNFHLAKPVLADEMLDKVVVAVTRVITLGFTANPPLQLAMSLALMAKPVSLAFESSRSKTILPSTSKRLNMLIDMSSPVRRLDQRLASFTKLSFDHRRAAVCRRHVDGHRHLALWC